MGVASGEIESERGCIEIVTLALSAGFEGTGSSFCDKEATPSPSPAGTSSI